MEWRISNFQLAHSPGHKICQLSMKANGVTFGTAEGDEFIQREIDIQKAAGWHLVAIMPSEAHERINLKFTDVKKRFFCCHLKGQITGQFDLEMLLSKLYKLGIENAQIDGFEVEVMGLTD